MPLASCFYGINLFQVVTEQGFSPQNLSKAGWDPGSVAQAAKGGSGLGPGWPQTPPGKVGD